MGMEGHGMNLFIRNKTVVLILNILFTTHLTVSGVVAALPPTVNYLGRLTGVIAPVRLAIDAFGTLYVTDPRNSGIMQYDSSGHLIKKFPLKGTRGVAVNSSGDLVVTQGNTAVIIQAGTGASSFPIGSFKQASGVAVDDSGNIYIVDTLDSVVQVFSPSGQPIPVTNSIAGKPFNCFGTVGTSGDQLFLPTAIAYDKASRQLVVSDTGKSRLVVFDTNGGFIRTIGGKIQNGTVPVFTSPQSVSLEYSKTTPQKLQRIYVTDSFQSEVQIIDPQDAGTYLGSIGGYGSAPGKLKVPVDGLFDPVTSRLLITNGAGDITIYGINVTSSPVPDTKLPALTLDPLPGVSYTDAVVIGGTVEREALLQITAPAGVVVSPPSFSPAPDATLNFWQAAISSLSPGANLISVSARNTALNPTIKTATITYDPSSAHVTIAPFSRPVNSPVQLLSGTMDLGGMVTLSGASGVTFDTVTTSGSAWQSRVSGLTEGVNTITATATVPGGRSSSAAIRITLLTTRPDLEISALPDGSKTSQTTLNISGILPLGSYFDSLTVNGSAVKVVNNAFSTALTLNPGSNQIAVIARDTAGNISEVDRTIILDELLPTVTIMSPSDGSYVNGTDIYLNGSVKPGNTVRLMLYNGSANGVPFTQINQAADGSSGLWSTAGAVPLDPGLNTIVVEVTGKSGISSRSKISVTRDATIPALSVISPVRDISVNKQAQTVTGKVAPGSDIIATLNNVAVPVTLNSDGTYAIAITFQEEKPYVLTITAIDALGKSVTTSRNLVYDVTAPRFSGVDSASPLKVTFREGVPEVFDKNGPVAGILITVNPDGSKTVDVSKAPSYDFKTLDIHAVDEAGNSTRNGNVTGSGTVDIKDALKLLMLAISPDAPTPEQMLRGDVAPVVDGVSRPDGVLDVFDVIYVLEKIVGLQ
jgi:sugar lactone lactonase YvrE